jgi:hypothetical protein
MASQTTRRSSERVADKDAVTQALENLQEKKKLIGNIPKLSNSKNFEKDTEHAVDRFTVVLEAHESILLALASENTRLNNDNEKLRHELDFFAQFRKRDEIKGLVGEGIGTGNDDAFEVVESDFENEMLLRNAQQKQRKAPKVAKESASSKKKAQDTRDEAVFALAAVENDKKRFQMLEARVDALEKQNKITAEEAVRMRKEVTATQINAKASYADMARKMAQIESTPVKAKTTGLSELIPTTPAETDAEDAERKRVCKDARLSDVDITGKKMAEVTAEDLAASVLLLIEKNCSDGQTKDSALEGAASIKTVKIIKSLASNKPNHATFLISFVSEQAKNLTIDQIKPGLRHGGTFLTPQKTTRRLNRERAMRAVRQEAETAKKSVRWDRGRLHIEGVVVSLADLTTKHNELSYDNTKKKRGNQLGTPSTPPGTPGGSETA